MPEKKVIDLAPGYVPKKPTLFRHRPGTPVGPGKGSSPRPYSVDEKTFAENWDRIFGKKE